MNHRVHLNFLISHLLDVNQPSKEQRGAISCGPLRKCRAAVCTPLLVNNWSEAAADKTDAK